nr:unnamed protein product [Callosobruchus analis]
MSIKSFNELHGILETKLSKNDTAMRRSVSSKERLSVTLSTKLLATPLLSYIIITELEYQRQVKYPGNMQPNLDTYERTTYPKAYRKNG